MEFDVTNIYTAITAEQAPVGAKGYFADNLAALKEQLEDAREPGTLKCIASEDYACRFVRKDLSTPANDRMYNFFYPCKKAPLWQETNVGAVLERAGIQYLVTAKDVNSCTDMHLCINFNWEADEKLQNYRLVYNPNCTDEIPQ